MKIFRLARKLLFKVRVVLASERDVAYLFDLGRIGERVRVVGTPQFGSEPFLVEIGDDTQISSDVSFITHRFVGLAMRLKQPNYRIYQRIRIGDRVSIGQRAIIMPGVTVGDDVIIGAMSLVSRDIPSGHVAVGAPARPIMTIQEFRDGVAETPGFELPPGLSARSRKEAIIRGVDAAEHG